MPGVADGRLGLRRLEDSKVPEDLHAQAGGMVQFIPNLNLLQSTGKVYKVGIVTGDSQSTL